MKLLLIDGNSLTYRAFFALPTDLATASGQVTNAVFGFTSMLVNLLRDHQPDALAVAFDRPEPTFRHERVPTYKAQRAETPDILRQQMGLVRQVVDTLGITTVELAGFEADDVLATLASRARDRGDDVIVVTGDRDAYQLVEDPHVKVLYNKRGVSDYVLYDEAGIEERTGVRPALYVPYAAMRGDPSDNLPGVPGVGEKTAAKLLRTYGGIDGVYAHLDEQTPKLRENLGANEDRVRSNAEVMVLVRDAPIEADLDALAWSASFDVAAVRELFDFLEFHSLYDRLAQAIGSDLGAAPGGAEVLEAEVSEATTPAEAVLLLERVAARSDEGPLAVAASWTGTDPHAPLEGIALVLDPAGGEVAWISEPALDQETVRDALRDVFAARAVVGHDLKPLVRSLLRVGVELRHLAGDTKLAAYLLDPSEARYALGELLVRYARLELPGTDEAAAGQLALETAEEGTTPGLDAARRALAVDRLSGPLLAALEEADLRRLHDEIEVPLVWVLATMEHLGVGVDRGELEQLKAQLAQEAAALRAAVHTAAGHEFNVNSTLQLRTVLYEELGLTPSKKTKTGYSTDAATLEKLRGEHPVIEHLLRYREVEKLRSTYADGLLAEIDPTDGRIHATFNQTVARTGRLSSDAPNLHNIPVRTEQGRAFRKVFVPAEGFSLLAADYSQIELRCIAHLAEDPGLIAAFEHGDDIHTETAARVFAVPPDEVTTEQRARAKMVSYGLAYGMESYGLAQRLNIAVPEAALILEAYFAAFPSVHDYMERTVAEARERGYTVTLFGRRRPIPELASNNYRIRQAGERQAMNAGIQGLAADIFKVALVRLDERLEAEAMATRVILQVHDEVLAEVPDDERDTAAKLVEEVLVGAAELRVPLEVHLAFGSSWAEAK